MPVNQDQSLAGQMGELREEIRHLREEQEQLRKSLASNGHGSPAESPPKPEEPGETKPEPLKPGQAKPQGEKKEEEQPNPPIRQRTRGFIRRHPIGAPLGIVALIALAIGGYFLLSYFNSYEDTDDAQVNGNLDPIGSRIAGTVIAVHVEDDYMVKAGEVLVELDPRDYQVAVEQARAAYNEALRGITAVNPNVPITVTSTQTTVSTTQSEVTSADAGVAAAERDYDARLADLSSAEAQSAKAQSDLRRYALLVGKDEISRQQYDAAVAAAKSDAAAVDAANASAKASEKALDQRRAQLAQARQRLNEAQLNAPRQISIQRADLAGRQAAAAAAKAQLDQAELNLSYTKIVAPVDGVVVSKSAEVGARLQAGEQVLSISRVDDLWLTANFKETQLKRMRPGQSVDIHVDALDQTYHGYVADMPGATGERTSLLPPENATGNFVKVVQRLPVRINLKPGENQDHRLRIGMSCEPKVWL